MLVQLYIHRVRRENVSSFLRIQKEAASLYKKYGALDDETFKPSNLESRYGCISFPDALSVKDDELILFSITRFRNRSHEGQVMAKVKSDKRINELYDRVTRLIEINRVVRGEFELVT
jgi:uncharacterized protein YbaA (DUF1428 family)